MPPWAFGLVVPLLLTAPPPFAGQRHTAWTLTVDNDLFALWRSPRHRSDRDYSSGVELSMARPLTSTKWARTIVLSLAHQVFTPDIEEPRPLPQDRPFVAILTGEAAWQWERPSVRHSLGARLSVTGPPALGSELQRLVHSLFDSPTPVGWEDQLPFEVGLTVAYAGDRGLLDLGDGHGLGLRTAAHWGGELGTIRSAATLGLGATAGWRPAPAWRPLAPERAERTGIRVFVPVGVGLDIVGQSIVVDGGVISNATGLDRETLVPYAEAGVGIELGAVALSWTGHITGRDFESQPATHRYGTFRVSVR